MTARERHTPRRSRGETFSSGLSTRRGRGMVSVARVDVEQSVSSPRRMHEGRFDERPSGMEATEGADDDVIVSPALEFLDPGHGPAALRQRHGQVAADRRSEPVSESVQSTKAMMSAPHACTCTPADHHPRLDRRRTPSGPSRAHSGGSASITSTCI